jgi:hypothetical protein
MLGPPDPDPVMAAIARGASAADDVNHYRDQLFEPVMALVLLQGSSHAHASIAGVVEACAHAVERKASGLPPIEGDVVVAFPKRAGGAA